MGSRKKSPTGHRTRGGQIEVRQQLMRMESPCTTTTNVFLTFKILLLVYNSRGDENFNVYEGVQVFANSPRSGTRKND